MQKEEKELIQKRVGQADEQIGFFARTGVIYHALYSIACSLDVIARLMWEDEKEEEDDEWLNL